jgi:hypothetical protein
MRPILRGRVNHKIAHYLGGNVYGLLPTEIKRWKISIFALRVDRRPPPTMEKTSVVGSCLPTAAPCNPKIKEIQRFV